MTDNETPDTNALHSPSAPDGDTQPTGRFGAEPSAQSDDTAEVMAAALKVLDQALDQFADRHQQPTASQVRLAMKRLTYNGFNPKALGFKRFRDFLEAAADDKRIELHDRPGDVLVARRGSMPAVSGSVRIRRDLWKATLDWSGDVMHFLDLETDKTVTFPTVPVPLEPEKFAQIRARVAAKDQNLVQVPSLDIHTQVRWMDRFVSTVEDDDVRVRLDHALNTSKPARDFAQVLRGEPQVQLAWNNLLGTFVYEHLVQWKAEQPQLSAVRIEAARDQLDGGSTAIVGQHSGPAKDEQSSETALMTTADSTAHADWRGVGPGTRVDVTFGPPRREADQLGGWTKHTRLRDFEQERPAVGRARGRTRKADRQLRLRIALHQAIDRMPEEELARIVIPAGYLIED